VVLNHPIESLRRAQLYLSNQLLVVLHDAVSFQGDGIIGDEFRPRPEHSRSWGASIQNPYAKMAPKADEVGPGANVTLSLIAWWSKDGGLIDV